MAAGDTGADLVLRDYLPRPALSAREHPVDRARRTVVDAHNHLGKWLSDDGGWAVRDVPRLLAAMDAANVGAIVNLDGRWGRELDENLERYDRRHPGRFVTFCQVDWAEAASPGFGERLARSLGRSLAGGARGLKVWKDLGLGVTDDRGRLLLPDDPRLAPLWHAAGEAGAPVLIHAADPVAFFDPVDARNERLEELLAHPDWSYACFGRHHHHRLVEALGNLAAAHPRTTFVAAHVAGAAEDLDLVERLLGAHPNLHVDIAARIAELGRQPRRARELLLRHADRVLFGTDIFPPDMGEYAIYFRFLETEDEHFAYSPDDPPPQGRWRISGLGLPDDVLEKVYAGNARRLVAGIDGR
ncbi:MAG TPA: amidohydrolase family protein [Thermoleophilia bacterium]|nr:amidohydrolase family protein [Thermoleophilia bacterium]